IDMVEPELSYFPLLAREKEVCILLTSEDFRNGMRAPGEPGKDLGNVFVAVDWSRQTDGGGGRGDFYPMFNQKHLAQFPVLHARSFARIAQHEGLAAECFLPPEYVEQYQLGALGARNDWTTPKIQTDLKRFILPLVGHQSDDFVQFDTFSEARFSEDLLGWLFTMAEAVHGPMNNAEKAFCLRSLAATLTYANSSKMFGRAGDSPEALRVLAVAMLNHANDLDPDAEGFSTAQLADYKGKLLGKQALFSCTAVLSSALYGQLRDQMKNSERFKSIYNAAVPANWRR
ncbi:hypothetical protein, partial [Paraburkholderia sp. RL17-373-BIF-A]|uniref:hypothetical protein n=1 Tax=Paraburkholderia sp. RL17-373-BIF-A TaxID=3031629 RepID=UPI0038BB26EE